MFSCRVPGLTALGCLSIALFPCPAWRPGFGRPRTHISLRIGIQGNFYFRQQQPPDHSSQFASSVPGAEKFLFLQHLRWVRPSPHHPIVQQMHFLFRVPLVSLFPWEFGEVDKPENASAVKPQVPLQSLSLRTERSDWVDLPRQNWESGCSFGL